MQEVMKKLEEHDVLFKKIDERFEQVDKRFDRLEDQLDLTAKTVLEQSDRMDRMEENMVTRTEHRELKNAVAEILTIVKKSEQEVTMLAQGVRRTMDKLEEHDKDIKRMKPMLGLA